jgi:hypothetical protein
VNIINSFREIVIVGGYTKFSFLVSDRLGRLFVVGVGWFSVGIQKSALQSPYMRYPVLKEMMDVLICHIYEDLEVASIIMKIQKDAFERQKLIKEYQFVAAKEECNISLEDYYIRYC